MKILRSPCVVGCSAVVLAVGLSACGRKPAEQPVVAPAPLAATQPAMPNPASTAVTVDGFVITWGQVLSEMQRLQPASQVPISAQQAADSLIVRRLLSEAADKAQVPVLTQEIATAVENVRRQIPTNTTLEAVLLKRNVSDAEFRSSIAASLKVTKLVQQKAQLVPVATDADIKQFVQENPRLLQVPENVRVRTILVAILPSDDAAARKVKKTRAENIRKQLLNGADFAKLAMTMSDDPSRARGGQLPPLQRGVVPDKTFENAAFAQPVGGVGPVLETQYGYVLLQVQQHTPAGAIKLDDVKERVRTLVTEQKRQAAVQAYISSLRTMAKITYAGAGK